MIEPCPEPSPDCAWFDRPTPKALLPIQEHGCFSDTDHILPRCLGTTALARDFLELPDNKQQMCRRLHDEKTHREQRDLPMLPNPTAMRRALEAAGRLRKRHR